MLMKKLLINLPNTLNQQLEISKQNNLDLLIAQINYQISEKEFNIEKPDYLHQHQLNYSKSENKDFSTTIDEIDQETLKATITWPIIKRR